MSSFFLLDHRTCPALPVDIRGDGHPAAFVYWEDLSHTGGELKQHETGDNVCRCPDDNGDSWTVADVNDAARGAYVYVEVPKGELNLVEINERLLACKANQDRV